MKQTKRFAALALILTLVVAFLPLNAYTASTAYTPTGYTGAEDVDYITRSEGGRNVIVNWGARNEDCTFLSTYAQAFYTGNNTWDILSQKSGGTDTSNAYTSNLYKALQSLMKNKHTNIQGYQTTRQFYQYTDCVHNDYSQISSFYSGNMVNGTWTGSTYNREHTWPDSKGLGGSDEDDIMMLRPTIVSENSSRGNTAYGESRNYFDPGEDVRGDCARIVLYIYTRWGNTGKMWGQSGVMESLDILLKWMEEDPVDTWEMGRNDSVQSITGTRNVFVDYPEFAWMIFGEEVPSDLVTPSGKAASFTPPVENPPVENPPVENPPAENPPVENPPVENPPVENPPVVTPPVTEPPVTEPPVTEPPVTDAPATEPPVTEAPATVPATGPGNNGGDPATPPGWIWICIPAAVLLIGAVVVIVIVIRKKKNSAAFD